MKFRAALYCIPALFLFASAVPAAAEDNDGGALNRLKAQAERGDIKALFQLGDKYAKGEGVEQDYVAAHIWFNLAAAGGHKEAAASRSVFSQLMTPEQVAEAQKRARQWFAQHQEGEK